MVTKEKTNKPKTKQKKSETSSPAKPELIEADSPKDTTSIDKQKGQERIDPIVVIGNEKQFGQSVAQWIVAGCAIGSLILVWYMTSQQLDRAKETFRIENRPWVFSSPPVESPITTTGEIRRGISVPIINSGKTPAYRVVQYVNWQHLDSIDLPQNFPFDSNASGNVLSPGATDIETIRPDQHRWEPASKRFFIAGRVSYWDYWGKPHYTTFGYDWVSLLGIWQRHAEAESADTNNEKQSNH